MYDRSVGKEIAVIVANGALRWSPEIERLCADAALLIAADGGAEHLARVDKRPDYLIGDLDSVTDATRRWIGEERVIMRPDQDQTDLEKALAFVLQRQKAGAVVVLGALGRRIDHLIGNIGLLARLRLGRRLVYRDPRVEAFATEVPVELPAEIGETWSFVTFDPAVRVTLRGVQWPVTSRALDAGTFPSISNRATESIVHVIPEDGPVVVIRNL